MTLRDLHGEQVLLRFFINESDRVQHRLVTDAIIETARNLGLAGCTAVRGIASYGEHHRLHSDLSPEMTVDLPVIVEVVDTEERIAKLVEVVKPLLRSALITRERAKVDHYGAAAAPTDACPL